MTAQDQNVILLTLGHLAEEVKRNRDELGAQIVDARTDIGGRIDALTERVDTQNGRITRAEERLAAAERWQATREAVDGFVARARSHPIVVALLGVLAGAVVAHLWP